MVFFLDSVVTTPLIEIDLVHFSGVGTYSLKNNNIPYSTGNVSLIDSGNNGVNSGVDGTVNITSTYPDVQGNFNFITANGTVVANGTFSAKAP